MAGGPHHTCATLTLAHTHTDTHSTDGTSLALSRRAGAEQARQLVHHRHQRPLGGFFGGCRRCGAAGVAAARCGAVVRPSQCPACLQPPPRHDCGLPATPAVQWHDGARRLGWIGVSALLMPLGLCGGGGAAGEPPHSATSPVLTTDHLVLARTLIILPASHHILPPPQPRPPRPIPSPSPPALNTRLSINWQPGRESVPGMSAMATTTTPPPPLHDTPPYTSLLHDTHHYCMIHTSAACYTPIHTTTAIYTSLSILRLHDIHTVMHPSPP